MSKLQLPRPAGKQPAAAQPQPERPQVPLLETDPAKGLTAEQAAQRMAAGLDNRAAASPTRSETEIIRDNIFTFFNLVFIVLALCLALVGSFANMTFLGDCQYHHWHGAAAAQQAHGGPADPCGGA